MSDPTSGLAPAGPPSDRPAGEPAQSPDPEIGSEAAVGDHSPAPASGPVDDSDDDLLAGVAEGLASAAAVGAAEPFVEGGPAARLPPPDLSVEALLDDVERLTGERDQNHDRLLRAQADFENSRKRLQRDAESRADAIAGRLVEDLLPVLDACDGAMAHGEAGVEPIFAALLQTLEKSGLERIDPVGDVFDPTRHDAVMHEPAGPDDDPALSLVSDVLRIGYAWKGRVVRAAMVKVRG